MVHSQLSAPLVGVNKEFWCFPVEIVIAEGCRSGGICLDRMEGCCCFKGEWRLEGSYGGEANELKELEVKVVVGVVEGE